MPIGARSVDLMMSQLRVISLLYSNAFPMKEVAGLETLNKPSEKDVKAVSKLAAAAAGSSTPATSPTKAGSTPSSPTRAGSASPVPQPKS